MLLGAGLIIPALLFGSSGTVEQRFQEGSLQLRLFPIGMRYVVEYLPNGGEAEPVPLFDRSNDFGAEIVVQDNGIGHLFGESSEFDFELDETSEIPIYVWRSPNLLVRHRFDFITDTTLQISINIRNLTDRTREIGLRYLLDTWLGEDGGHHFRLSNGQPIDQETVMSDFASPTSIISSNSGDPTYSLLLPLSGVNIVSPDRVILANWQRLSGTLWRYRVREGDDFGVSYISNPDSAVAYYFDPAPIEPNAARNISIVMGVASGALNDEPQVIAMQMDLTGTPIRSTAVENLINGEGETRYDDNLDLLNRALEEVDRYIENVEQVQDEQIDVFEEQVEDLVVPVLDDEPSP